MDSMIWLARVYMLLSGISIGLVLLIAVAQLIAHHDHDDPSESE